MPRLRIKRLAALSASPSFLFPHDADLPDRTFLDIESDIIHIVTEHLLSRGDGNERTNVYMCKYEGNGFQEY